MFKTTCSNCGKDCEVPFKPTNTKPVYCSDCFEKMGGGGRNDRRPDSSRFNDRRPQGGGGSDQNTPLLESLNTKLDKIIGLLETKNRATEPVKSPETVKESNKAVAKVADVKKEIEEVAAEDTPKVKKAVNKTSKAKK